ncbi:MAG TPA: hypothetical protein VKQ11_00055 [Candidatus Sulfotelmatobacter sp.]|nr:hypothetical protein [Candidatus Sulfotelmatobacter sp.]
MSTGPIPIQNPDATTTQPDRLLTAGSYSTNAFTTVARWLGRTGSQIGCMFTRSGSSGASRVHELKARAVRLKDEHPLPVLGAIAGTAFALGVGARVWRSRRS